MGFYDDLKAQYALFQQGLPMSAHQAYYNRPNPVNATFGPPGSFGGPRTDIEFNPAGEQTYGSSDREYLRIVDAFNQQRQFTDAAFEQSRGLQGQQLARIGQGYDQARKQISQYGQSAKRSAIEREEQLASELGATAGNRTYAADYGRRGLASQTDRVLASIDESIGQLYSNLTLSQTGQETSVLGGLAASYLAQSDTYANLLAQEKSLLGGYAPGGGSDKSGLYELLGAVAGAGGYALGGYLGNK